MRVLKDKYQAVCPVALLEKSDIWISFRTDPSGANIAISKCLLYLNRLATPRLNRPQTTILPSCGWIFSHAKPVSRPGAASTEIVPLFTRSIRLSPQPDVKRTAAYNAPANLREPTQSFMASLPRLSYCFPTIGACYVLAADVIQDPAATIMA